MSDEQTPAVVHTIDRTNEYTTFIEEVRKYYERRGTHWEAEPKVGSVPVDLLKLFRLVMANGGYDKVSDEKRAWRRMIHELGIPSRNDSSTGYCLKGHYYRLLAAYEISTVHGKEPPPPEIFEATSAKGGSLLTRTVENYRRREQGNDSPLPSGASTPAIVNAVPADPASGAMSGPPSVRASRGLREQPAQRVIFQPDTGPTRGRFSATQQQQTQQQQQQHQMLQPLNSAGMPGGSLRNAGPTELAAPQPIYPWHGIRGASAASTTTENEARFVPRPLNLYQTVPASSSANDPSTRVPRRQPVNATHHPLRWLLASELPSLVLAKLYGSTNCRHR